MKHIQKYFIISTIIAIIFGTLLHFAYDIFNSNLIIGFFSPINESVWEHLKLVFLPITLFAIFSKIKFKYTNIIISSLISIIIASIFIVLVHYTFLALNIESITIDIIAYILGMLIAFYIMYIFHINRFLEKYEYLGYILLIILFVLFVIFTLNPPKNKLFIDKTISINNNNSIYLANLNFFLQY